MVGTTFMRHCFYILNLVTLLGFLDVSHMSRAQEPEVTTLDPVLVTGTAQPTHLHQVTQSITIMEEKQFSPLHTNRVASLLQQIPGVHVDEMGARGGISSLYLRGADPNFTLVLLDGIPLNDSTNQRGGSVDLSTLPMERIVRVEIVRGPLSSIYGTEGMAGAVNFITRPAPDTPNIRLVGEGGRYETFRGILQAGGSLGPLSTHLSLAHSRNGEQVEKDRFALTSVGWTAALGNSSDWDIRLNGQFSSAAARSFPEGSGGPQLAVIRETEKRDTEELISGISLASTRHSFLTHRLLLNFLRRTQTIATPGILSAAGMVQLPPAHFQTTFYRLQSRLIETWDLNPRWTLSVGGQLSYENGEQSGTQDLSAFGGSSSAPSTFSLDRFLGGIFTELRWSPTETWVFNPGIRIDLSQGFQPRFSPRAGASYQILPWLKIRGGYGKGFKLPSLASLGDPQIGNPLLKPETSSGWDAGLIFQDSEATMTASVDYFHNTFRNLIDLDPKLLNQDIFQLTNLQETTTKGVEGSITLSPTQQLSLKTSATYLETRIHKTDEPLRNRPKWRAGGSLTLKIPPSLMFVGRITYVGSRRDFQVPTQSTTVGDYIKVDMTLNYRSSQIWNWYLALENLTNHSYEEYRGFSSPSLTFRFGVEYGVPSVP